MTNATGKNENQTQLLTKDFNLGRPYLDRGNPSFFYYEATAQNGLQAIMKSLSQVVDGFEKFLQMIHVIHFPLVSYPQFYRSRFQKVNYFSLDVRLDISTI